jgi:diadenosine tetraphosphatase ApaH/serine/threonine PP2A family protein phosphatase
MRYAVISDIHGNLEAFDAVLKEIKRQLPDGVLFIGDIVGYGANPNQSIDLLKGVTETVIAGNHDYAAAGLADCTSFNPCAKESIVWTQNNLTSDHMEYLKKLPFLKRLEGITLVHSSPKEPEKWHYLFGMRDISDNFDFFDTKVCFVGHTHVPLVIAKDREGRLSLSFKEIVEIRDDSRYLINAGSVGQPRDGNNKALCLVYDTKKGLVQFFRVPYNIEKAKNKIIKEGIPAFLGYRLDYGR